ncbi:MAG: efflux RND transporter periplasmic adaptor subunit [Gemmataceae bacterium]|nr:efflux RND transporter periplasmic adaptor subunit [Gemmataceae bacterium]
MKRKMLVWLFILIPLGAAGTWMAFGRSHAPEAEPSKSPAATELAVAVTTDIVTPRPVRRRISVVGSLFGQEELVISPKVEGRITKIHCDLGDVVKPNALLLEIDDSDFKLAVREAERALELELAKINAPAVPGREFDVKKLPSVEKAATVLANSARRLDRLQKLGNSASREELEQAEMEYHVARANHAQALLEAEATLATIRLRDAYLATARQKLADTRVVAPPAPIGTEYSVAQRMASEGEMLRNGPNTSMTVFRLVIDRTLKLQATVPERHLGQIKEGQDVEVNVEAYPGETFAGVVARVNPTVDRTNRTFQIEVTVPNASRKLRAGSFAKAFVVARGDDQALTVPEESLVIFAGVTKVFVVEKDVAREVPVTTGPRFPTTSADKTRPWTEVTGKLRAGDKVITSGMSQLSDGKAVRLR